MSPSEAINYIRKVFNDPQKTLKLGQTIPEETFIKVLNAIEKRLPYPDGPTGRAICYFLYSGCVRFNRWITTSYVIEPDMRSNFDRFVYYLNLSINDNENKARFFVDQIKWDLYSILDHKALSNITTIEDKLLKLENKLKSISVPKLPEKQKEFLLIASECELLIFGARNNNLKTKIATKIPIVPVDSPTHIETNINNITVNIDIKPHFTIPPNNFISVGEGAIAIPDTPSQWQHGFSEVLIECAALLDPAAGSIPLTADLKHQSSFELWPDIYKDTFEILDLVIWKMRENYDLPGRWILLPSDIATIEWELWVNSNRIGWMVKGPPSSIIKVTNKTDITKNLILDVTSPTEPYVRCRILAENFLGTGETNEALFWINVATEAFFEKRCKEICIQNKISYEELSSGKAYWERAEEVILEQFPNLKGKIIWPESAIGVPSWFTRLKFLSKKVPLKSNINEILSKYSIINKHRNALFHGFHEGRVSTNVAKDAIEAFKWLEENL